MHYCEREGLLADLRKRKSFARRNAEPEDPACARVKLLSRTLREREVGLGARVEFLKISYMAREVCKVDLARIVAVTPNLRYVDLPRGFYENDSSCTSLRAEIQASCAHLRKMRYKSGSESSLQNLIGGKVFPRLEVLELDGINLDSVTMRQAFGQLKHLRALRVSNMDSFTTEVLAHGTTSMPFPPLVELVCENTPNLTSDGFIGYLGKTFASDTLDFLSLTNTGVDMAGLAQLLPLAHALTRLTIAFTPTLPLPPNVPPLASSALEVLHFEITPQDYTPTSPSAYLTRTYYDYLRLSVLAHSLPMLHSLYVRDPDFPERLAPYLNNPPPPSRTTHLRGDSGNIRFSSNNPFRDIHPGSSAMSASASSAGPRQQLEIYSKGEDQLSWAFANLRPVAPRRTSSGQAVHQHHRSTSATSTHSLRPAARPRNDFGLAAGARGSWSTGAGARRSVFIGDSAGFLAVPGADGVDGAGGSDAAADDDSLKAPRMETTGERFALWR